jgi:flagellar assembly protein FliH
MLCKLVDPEEDETEPMVWRNIGPEPPGLPAAQTPLARGLVPFSGSVSSAGAIPKGLPFSKTGAKANEHANQLALLQKRIAELEAQIPMETQQARQAGMEKGLRQAREEAAAEMQGALDRLASTIQELAQVKRKIRHEAETELVKLALAIARRILHREVSADPQSICGIVYAALQRLQNREIARIRVFPAALQAVRSALERNGGMAAIEIIPDTLLQPGGIVFETALGELDASVETQLQEIERGFADRLQR